MPSKVKSENGKPLSKSALKLRLLKRLKCTTRFERELWASGAQLVAGVDEVGRGALFGPVVAGAVILDPNYRIKGLRDSKLLPANRREILAERIKQHCIAWSVAAVDVARIDQLNIYHATRLAMTEAVQALASRAGLPPDRCHEAGARVPAEIDHSRRCTLRVNCRSFDRSEGGARSHDHDVGSGVPGIQAGL